MLSAERVLVSLRSICLPVISDEFQWILLLSDDFSRFLVAGHMFSVECHTAGGPQTLAVSPKTFKLQSQQNTGTETLEIIGFL